MRPYMGVMQISDSTSSTLQGMRLLVQKAGANVVGEAAIFTESERTKRDKIVTRLKSIPSNLINSILIG